MLTTTSKKIFRKNALFYYIKHSFIKSCIIKMMKQKKKHLAFWIIFPICWTILSFMIIFYMDFTNGPLIWFILELIFLVGLFVVRILLINSKKRYKFLTWGAFVLLTISVLCFDKPSFYKKSASY